MGEVNRAIDVSRCCPAARASTSPAPTVRLAASRPALRLPRRPGRRGAARDDPGRRRRWTAIPPSPPGRVSASSWSNPTPAARPCSTSPGPPSPPQRPRASSTTCAPACRPGDVVVLSGSLPDSVDPAVAGEIVDIGNAAGARTIVDIHSEALRHAVSPVGHGWSSATATSCLSSWARSASRLGLATRSGRARWSACARRGIEVVVVTLGRGRRAARRRRGCRPRRGCPRSRSVNATGSGDLLLAGLSRRPASVGRRHATPSCSGPPVAPPAPPTCCPSCPRLRPGGVDAAHVAQGRGGPS